MFYGVVILTKLAICANTPESGVGALLDFEGLRTTFYLDKLIALLLEATAQANFCVPKTFFSILVKLTRWYNRHQLLSATSDKPDELLQPMAYMKTEEMPVEVNASAAINAFRGSADGHTMIQSALSGTSSGSHGDGSHSDQGTWQNQGQQPFSYASTAAEDAMHGGEPSILTATHGAQLQQQEPNAVDMLQGQIRQEFASFEAYTSSELDFAFLTFDSGVPSQFNSW
jgi:hypothetical protein